MHPPSTPLNIMPTSHSSFRSISSMSCTMFLRCPCSIPNLWEMQETSLAVEMADNFLAKSVDSFLLVKIEDFLLVVMVYLLWWHWLVSKHWR